ncbi:MAG: discoidin domain-containing protein [Spirochaetaceae bacterium]|nr:discoidin domain-containing protein [Spirochaetaceae bacterium]
MRIKILMSSLVVFILLCTSCTGLTEAEKGRVLLAVPGNGFDEIQYRIIHAALAQEGFEPVSFSPVPISNTTAGFSITTDIQLENIQTENYRGVVILSGENLSTLTADAAFLLLCKKFHKEGKLTAAAGPAVEILARADLVFGTNISSWSSADSAVRKGGGILKHTVIEYDNGILSGIGESDTNIMRFSGACISILQGKTPDSTDGIIQYPFTLDEQNYRYHVTHSGHFRTGELYVPQSYDSKKKYSIVFVLHGQGNRAHDARSYGFDNMAELYDFIVIYPDGYNGDWDIFPMYKTEYNDPAMIQLLIDEIQKRYSVDTDRIYATGHSLGGFMSYRLGYDMGGIITAVAPVAGLLYKPWTGSASSLSSSLLHIHALDDMNVRFENDGIYENPIGVMDCLNLWKNLTGTAYTKEEVFISLHGIEGRRVLNPDSGIEVASIFYPSGGHTWPIFAAEQVSSFFYNHPPRQDKFLFNPAGIPSYIEKGQKAVIFISADKGAEAESLVLFDNGNQIAQLSGLSEFLFNAADTGVHEITGRAFMSDGEEIEFSNQLHFTVIDADFAKNKMSAASSVENEAYKSGNAFDHDSFTRWASSFTDPQWLTADLGNIQTINAVTLCWEAAFASEYEIRISQDGETWVRVYECSEGRGGTEKIQFPAVKARFVQLYGKKRSTQWGYSLWDMFVHML